MFFIFYVQAPDLIVSPRGGLFEGEKYLKQAEALIVDLEKVFFINFVIFTQFPIFLRYCIFNLNQISERDVDIVPIAQAAQESQFVEAERVPSQIEKALSDLQACTLFAYIRSLYLLFVKI